MSFKGLGVDCKVENFAQFAELKMSIWAAELLCIM